MEPDRLGFGCFLRSLGKMLGHGQGVIGANAGAQGRARRALVQRSAVFLGRINVIVKLHVLNTHTFTR